MSGLDLAQECALLGKNELVLLCKIEIRHAFVVGVQPCAIHLVGREVFERDQRERDIVGALMRHPVAEQMAAAFRDDSQPAPGIGLEHRALERIDLVADEYGDGQQSLLYPEFILALDRHECFVYHRSMKAGPDIALVASLVGDPARSNMLTALMSGPALTASELAQEAGVTPQTASTHLAKLEPGGLVEPEKQGRHRYYRLTGPDVAGVLEGLMGLAARVGHLRIRTGPKDPALRHARVCYDHLAGELGVQMLDAMTRQHLVRRNN